MKQRILAFIAAVVIGSSLTTAYVELSTAPAEAKVSKVIIMKTMTGSAIQATTDSTIYTRKITFQSRVGNGATVYVGLSGVSSSSHLASLSAGQAYTITPSVFLADQNEEFQLDDFYVIGTAADVVAISYEIQAAP